MSVGFRVLAVRSRFFKFVPLLTTYLFPDAFGWEIREHTERMGKHWKLYDHAIWQTAAKEMRWNDKDSVWVVTTDRGDVIRTRFLVTAGGPINVPR